MPMYEVSTLVPIKVNVVLVTDAPSAKEAIDEFIDIVKTEHGYTPTKTWRYLCTQIEVPA